MTFFDTQSEQIVIASMLLKEEFLLLCKDEISEGFFYSKLLRVLFTLIVKSYDKFHSIIIPSVLEKLLKKSDISIDVRKKYAYLIDKFQKKEISDIEFKVSLDSMKENYLKRRLVDVLSYISQKIETEDSNKLYTALEDVLMEGKLILTNNTTIQEGDIKNAEERLKLYEDIRLDPKKYMGIPSGFSQLDMLTGGFQNGEFGIIVGKQGSGKSLLLMNMAYNAWTAGYNIVYFTLEMPKIQIERRFDARLTAMTYYKIKTQQITELEAEEFRKSLREQLAKRQNIFYIVDIPKFANPLLIESKTKQLQKKFKIDLIIVDYMGLMSSNSGKKEDNWERMLSIANDLKFTVARPLSIPLITAGQITSSGLQKKNFGEDYDIEDLALTRRLADPCDIILGLKTDVVIKSAKLNVIKYRDGQGPGIYLYADLDRCIFTEAQMDENK